MAKKKSKAMREYLKMSETHGCPECKSDATYETHACVEASTGPRGNKVLVCICDDCGHVEICPEQPKNMIQLVSLGSGSSIRDADGNILPEFLKKEN